MKSIVNIWILLSSFYCAGNASIETEKQNSGGASNGTTVFSSVKVKDGNDSLLGYITEGDEGGITILTTTGWFTKLKFDGTNSISEVYYSSVGCSGTAYYSASSSMYGKTLIYDGVNYHKPASMDANNVSTSSSQSFASRRSSTGCNAISSSSSLVTLTSAVRTESGLPATITLPLKMSGQ